MNVKLMAELLGTNYVAVNLGRECGLVEIGSAVVEECDGRWHVSACVLEDDGVCRRWNMPDSFAHESEAQRLADSLNELQTA
jgi:hypothetical protein